MHVRVSQVSRGGNTYRYAQLVESFRREDGVPAHRVLAHLGKMSDVQLANFKAALAANRNGQKVAVAAPQARRPSSPDANLRYLDLAVLLALWRELGLGELLTKLLPKGQADALPADVVAALVLQRCVAPGSKLYAERWFPRTALPELLALAPASFNNTRLHRVLDELDAATPALMSRLPSLYLEHERRAVFTTLYLDVTDAYFVGHGPHELAVRGKTKEGLLQRKIGIVLLCNEQGYPLRWQVVAGNASDCSSMTDMFRSVARSAWAQGVPIVCDRAMGATAQLREMASTGLRFLTSLRTTEFETYAPRLPHEVFAALDVPADATEQACARQCELAAKQAQTHAGLTHVTDTLWVSDLGVVELASAGSGGDSPRAVNSVAEVLRLGRKIEEAVETGQFSSFNAASRAHDIQPQAGKKYRRLCRLPQDVQQAILDGEAARCSLSELLGVADAGDADEQRKRFAALLQSTSTRDARSSLPAPAPAPASTSAPLCVRVIAYFNPERFVEQRLSLARQTTAIATFIRQLNQRLAGAHCRLTREGVLAAVDRRLRRDDFLGAYQVNVTEAASGSRMRYQVALEPVASEWQRRRRFHGFTVLVGHAALPDSAAALCRTYRAKDMVEKDFQVIKSVVKLRPIRHHTEAKVSAHVTLCMLALALERHLGQRLEGHCTAELALETLANCHLNQYRGKTEGALPLYSLTTADAEQLALLRKLRLPLLADNDDLAAKLTPRAS